MFESLKQDDRRDGRRYLTSLLVSLVAHAAVLTVMVIVPLIFFNVLHADELVAFFVGPPAINPEPPAPPATTPGSGGKARAVAIRQDMDVAPIQIPEGIAPPVEEASVQIGITNLVQGISTSIQGVAKGIGLDEIIGKKDLRVLEPPPPPTVRTPIRVGGMVQEAKLIHRIEPVYPTLAIQTRTSGVVKLEATIDEEGSVTEVKIIGGHPLLVKAAADAVRQWKYRPTLLNGEPLPVIAEVTVTFRIR